MNMIFSYEKTSPLLLNGQPLIMLINSHSRRVLIIEIVEYGKRTCANFVLIIEIVEYGKRTFANFADRKGMVRYGSQISNHCDGVDLLKYRGFILA